MDDTAMAMRVDTATGLPPGVLTFTVEGSDEEMTYRREPQERPGLGWHAHYENPAAAAPDAAPSAPAGTPNT